MSPAAIIRFDARQKRRATAHILMFPFIFSNMDAQTYWDVDVTGLGSSSKAYSRWAA
jgi:hypothetical protein